MRLLRKTTTKTNSGRREENSQNMLTEEDEVDFSRAWDEGDRTVAASGEGHDNSQTSDHHARTILHFDVDCFYAQVEMLRDPSLRDKPLGIQQKNIVVTSNYLARAKGVGKCAYVRDAKQVSSMIYSTRFVKLKKPILYYNLGMPRPGACQR